MTSPSDAALPHPTSANDRIASCRIAGHDPDDHLAIRISQAEFLRLPKEGLGFDNGMKWFAHVSTSLVDESKSMTYP